MFKLLKYADKYKFYAFLCPVLMIGEVVFELLIPQVMANIVKNRLHSRYGIRRVAPPWAYGKNSDVFVL